MKIVKVLQNQNKLCSELTSDADYPRQCGNFSVRLVFTGSEHYTIGTRKITLYPGTLLTLNEGTSYSRKIDSDVAADTFSVFFTPQFLSDFHTSITSQDSRLLDNPFVEHREGAIQFLETLHPFTGDMKYNIQHLRRHFHEGNTNELLLNEYLYHTLLLYYRLYHTEVMTKSENLKFLNRQTRVEVLKRLTIARDYMLSNYNRYLSLEEISRQSCLSVNHLLRTFKQAFGCSPHQYLMQVRLKQAKFLLKHTSYSVNEVVDLVGFECPSSFIRLFKNNYKVTPGIFRLGAA